MSARIKTRPQPIAAQRRPPVYSSSKIPRSPNPASASTPADDDVNMMDSECPYIHVDRKAIHTDLESRIRYLHSFIDFSRDDIDALISGAKYVKALIPTAVDSMYAKLLQYDITAQSFNKKTKKDDGQEKLPSEQSSEILRRKIFLRWYLTKLCSDPSKMEYWEYMDKVGRMHIGRDPLHSVHVDYMHIGMTLGFVMDVFIQTLMSHPQIPFGRKLGLLRALSKVMWIQNDLFARWYVRDGQEYLGEPGDADADKASTRSKHSNGSAGSNGSSGTSGSNSSNQSNGSSNSNYSNHGDDGTHKSHGRQSNTTCPHLAPKDNNNYNNNNNNYNNNNYNNNNNTTTTTTATTRTAPSHRNERNTQSIYSNHSSKALSEASTVVKSRDDETASVSSAATATTQQNTLSSSILTANQPTTSLESKSSLGQLSTSSTSTSTTESRSAFSSMRRMLSNSSRRLDMTKKEKEEDAPTIPLIINNEFSATQKQFDVRNPATGNLVGRCSSASVEDANCAVEAAQAAFRVWSKMQPYARRDLMMRAAEIMLNRKEELIRYQREETGAGRLFAEHTFMLAVSFLKDFASRIPSIEGSVPTVAEEGRYAMVIKEPYGVILGIVPWNAPYLHGTRTVALPLAAGNTIVLKGSELSPRCFWALGDVYREAGLPAGCVNVLYHQSSQASSVTTALIAHPYVRKINFMGSSQVGSVVASIAGRYVKPIVLGLGGKASAIVLDDANLGKAAMGCIVGSFMHGGQICMSTERIIVQRSVLDKFRRVLVDTAQKVFERDAPPPILISATAVEKNKSLVADAVSKGANILFGDPTSRETSKASMRPLIVENVTRDMQIYFTESFGPTVSLVVVDSEEDAIAVANDTEYGLTAAIYTENLFRAIRVGRELQCGSIHINSTTIHDSPGLPHGGWKNSGYGRSGGGSSCYDEFLQTKTITWVEQ